MAVLSVLCAAWVLRLWRADLTLPLRYAPVDDTKFYLMLVKGIIEHGWYLSNPALGAPFGQHLADYPQGADDLNLLIIRGLGVVSSNPALVVNLFYLLSFALASFTAHLVLRAQGISAPVAGVIAVLFSLLAYHFFRGESHLLLSAYYAVPLSAYLFLGVLGDRALFARRVPARTWLRWTSSRSLKTIAVCAVVGSAGLYYATFAVVLVIGGGLISLTRRRGRAALGGAVAVAVMVATLAANLAPSFAYQAVHGVNSALERSATADERSGEAFSLRLTNLILPAPGDSASPLHQLAASYDNAIAPGYCEACYASLGTVGTLGFLWLALAALGTLVGGAGWYGGRRLFGHGAAGVAIMFAVGTVGGFSGLIELVLTPDIRGWNRISVPIAFLSLLAAGLLLDSLVGWVRSRPRGGQGAVALLLAVALGLGVIDQDGGAFTPAYAGLNSEYRSDGAFVAQIQARLPRGAAVFQLPYVPFPEGYPNTPVSDAVATYATKYEPLRGYLHSTALRWSYGAVKGRPADWPAQLAGQPLSYVVAAVTATGFDGLWVDPAGFEPALARRLRAGLVSILGRAPLLSPDQELWFFDLRPYRLRLQRSHSATQLTLLRARTLQPLRTACSRGRLSLVNPSLTPRPATLTVYSTGGVFRRRLLLAPGRTGMRITPATLRPGVAAALLYGTLTDQALVSFASGSGDTVSAGLTGPPCSG